MAPYYKGQDEQVYYGDKRDIRDIEVPKPEKTQVGPDQNVLDLNDIDWRSIGIMRTFLCTLKDCPAELKVLEEEAKTKKEKIK